MLIVQACSFIEDGDGYYREYEPSRHLGRLPGITVIDCHVHHFLFPRLMELSDVFILPFFHGWEFFPIIERRRQAGKITVLETNDYYTDLPMWSPIWRQWLDSDIETEHVAYIGAVDAIQTSTSRLGKHWEQLARKVAVFPNHLSNVSPLAPIRSSPLTIGWAGSEGHLADWYHTSRLLQPWFRAQPEVRLAVMGSVRARKFVDLPPEQYRFQGAGPIQEYNQFLSTIDIGLAPLLPTEYNFCRSDVKFLEYAANGVVGIYASPGPYDQTVVHEKTGFLYRDEQELFSYLELLSSNQELRERIRNQAYEYVTKERLLKDRIHERAEFYRSLLHENSQGKDETFQEIPPEVFTSATQEETYFRIELDPLGQTLAGLMNTPSSPETLSTLLEVLESRPGYLLAHQICGRVLNDLRRPHEAMDHLLRALQDQADSARTLSELGRSFFLLGDFASARQHMEQSLHINPRFVPGWAYFLRFLKLHRQADEAQWLNSVKEFHPDSITLALLILDFYEGAELIARLNASLDYFSRRLRPQQLEVTGPQLINVLVSKILPLVTPLHSEQLPSITELLKQACKIFPNSAKLKNLLGISLRAERKHQESDQSFRQALTLKTTALCFRQEYENDAESYYWQLAEHIAKTLNPS